MGTFHWGKRFVVFDIRHVEARYIDARDNRGIRLKYRNTKVYIVISRLDIQCIDVRDNRGLRLIEVKNTKVYMYTYNVDMCICNHATFWSTVYEFSLYIRQTIQPWKIASFHLWSCRVYKPYFERDCIAHVQLIVENRYLLDKDNWVKPENKCSTWNLFTLLWILESFLANHLRIIKKSTQDLCFAQKK